MMLPILSHDIDDFYRAGLIPLDLLLTNYDERDGFLEKVVKSWKSDEWRRDLPSCDYPEIVFDGLTKAMFWPFEPLTRPYSGIRKQRAAIRTLTASLISRYITRAVDLNEPGGSGVTCVTIDPELEAEVYILKQLTWEYVITAPSLSTQQYGQRRLIEDLFRILIDAVSKSDFSIFPPRYREHLEEALRPQDNRIPDNDKARIVSDYISGMTEREAISLHQRLTGMTLGSVLDPLSY